MDKKKILFIEDEPDQILVIKARLEANGFEVESAMDGEEGLKKVYEIKPDLILLDLIMPKMNGFEVCRRLKSDDATKNIPVLIITAAGMKDLEEQCRINRSDGLIRKPYDSAEFVAKVKKMLLK